MVDPGGLSSTLAEMHGPSEKGGGPGPGPIGRPHEGIKGCFSLFLNLFNRIPDTVEKLCVCDDPVEPKKPMTYAGASGEFGGDIKMSER